jgi:uncharacterized protein YcgI (DUF1989 family)
VTGYLLEMPGGASDSLRLRRHRTLTLRCLGPGANVATLIYALDDKTERLNVPDTLKAQMSARITAPMALMSDMGRAMASVTGSSLDWHDAITGYGLPGVGSARDGLLGELWKHGLGTRDLHATVNFFSKVAPTGDERGSLVYEPGYAQEGDWVTLRADIDLLVVLSTARHPLDPSTSGDPAGVRLEVAAGPAPGPDDPGRSFRAETARALELAERSYA